MTYLLGIDVGTTRTAAAVSHPDRPGEPEMVTLGDRSLDVPSVLYMAPDGGVLVGEAAERRAVTDPDRVVREFKRRVGDPTPIVVAGRPWRPEQLCALLVRWVVDRVAEREGGRASRIAVTHPAAWGDHKKELLAEALHEQGLTVTFLAEPQAAALHYATSERVGQGSTIAVYDLGGGTFDAAVVRKDGGFGLLGRPEGLERLGGIDFDQVVFDHVVAGAPEAFSELDDSDPAVLAAVARIRRECTEAKEALSADTEVSIPVLLPSYRGSVRLHRSEFEEAIHGQIDETVAALRRAVASAGLSPDRLSAVLLVGGSSRIPLVAQLVSEQLERPVAVDTDPKNAIAKGAVIMFLPQLLLGSTGAFTPARGAAPPGALGSAGLGGGPAGFAGAGPDGPGTGYAEAGQGTGGWTPAPTASGGWGLAGGGGPGVAPDGSTETLPTEVMGAGGPPARPAVGALDGAEGFAEYEAPEPKRRSPIMLISAGGVVAALAVVGAVVFWPQASPVGNATPRIDPSAVATAPPAPSAETTTTEEGRQVAPAAETSQRTNRPAPTVAPPPATVTVAPPPATTTTSPAPPTTTPPKSTPPATSSSPTTTTSSTTPPPPSGTSTATSP